MGALTSRYRLGLILGCLAILVAVHVPQAQADSSQDSKTIGFLEGAFNITATNAELTQMLDSPGLGPSIEGDAECAYYGANALSPGLAEEDVLSELAQDSQTVITADQVAEAVAEDLLGVLPGGEEIDTLLDVHSEFEDFSSDLDLLVSTIGKADTEDDYLSFLSQYYGAWLEEGGDPNATESTFLMDVGGAAQPNQRRQGSWHHAGSDAPPVPVRQHLHELRPGSRTAWRATPPT
jgi:hypothetical protein